MHTQKKDHLPQLQNDPGGKGRLLIFIVAYNAENTIENVLKRIPVSLSDRYDIEF